MRDRVFVSKGEIMVRFGMAAAALALMASPLLAQESTEQLKKELQELRAEVDALKAVNTTKEIPSSGKAAQDAMAADDNPVMTLFKQTKLSGFVDAGYVFSFNQLHSDGAATNNAGQNPSRLFDNLGNSFYLNAVQLQLERLASKDMIVGYHIELAAGHDPLIYDGAAVTLQEGWAQIMAPVGDGLDIRVGRMAALHGYEVLESVNDMNYSRSMLFSVAQAFTHTGVRAAYWFGEQFGATIGFNNGFNTAAGIGNKFADDNHGKGLEFQFAAKPVKDLYFGVTGMVAHENTLNTGDLVFLMDIVASYTMDKLTVALNWTHVGIQGVATQAPGSRAEFHGIALYGKYQLTDAFSQALRIEYFSDVNGFVGGINGGTLGPVVAGDSGTGSRIVDLTLTSELKVAQQLILRFEIRHDNSNNHNFSRGNDNGAAKAARGDTTLGFEAIMPF